MFPFLIFIAVTWVAYSNGANDNMKGVATLVGSKTLSYRKALMLTTTVTLLGSLTAILLAGALLKVFSGKGLVPIELVSNPVFLFSVAVGAAFTVWLATIKGFPISTTHALTGALVGSGLALSSIGIEWAVLGTKFFIPLMISPFLAVLLSASLNLIFKSTKKLFARSKVCVCVGKFCAVPAQHGNSFSFMSIIVAPAKKCHQIAQHVSVKAFKINLIDVGHVLSGSWVSFARGLNDTPKIAALLLASSIVLSPALALLIVGLAIALGGLLQAYKVSHTMSFELSGMNHQQGFLANIVTGFLVTFASSLGIPVSTTHVSVGSIIGLGSVTHQAKWKRIGEVIFSWVLTLPIAAGVAFLLAYLLKV